MLKERKIERATVVHLTKTVKKTKEQKAGLIEKVGSGISNVMS